MQTTAPDHTRQHAPDALSQAPAGPEKLPGIRHIIAVGSGKGGVGKSTVSVNLALALQQRGARVGLVDADILGPSIPGMLGIPTGEPPAMTLENRMIPAERHGLKVVSMGMLTGDDQPAVLRGPMVGKYLKMFVGGVQWGELDYLILDLPPGTGDTQLTLAQSMPLSGVVIVTTPQAVSLKIARRGLRMFEKVQVPILGIVENMRTFTCPHCGETTDIFRHGGGELMAQLSTADTGLKPFVWKWDSNEGAPAWNEGAVQPSGARNIPVGLLRRDPRTLSLLWQDGHRDDLDVRDLRLACRCALCVEEMSGRKLLDPATVRADVSPRQIVSIGNYAIQFDWSDGHNSGIYAFNDLRGLGERAALQGAEDV